MEREFVTHECMERVNRPINKYETYSLTYQGDESQDEHCDAVGDGVSVVVEECPGGGDQCG
jgi:hypothetical protein